jgi:hypothetical protein
MLRSAPHFSPRHASPALSAAGRLSRSAGGGGGSCAPPPAGALGALSAAAARTAAAFGPLDAAHAAGWTRHGPCLTYSRHFPPKSSLAPLLHKAAVRSPTCDCTPTPLRLK